jgi:Trp operon repressor
MPNDDINAQGPRRRVILRRARSGGGFGMGGGVSTRSESLRAPAEEYESDEVDDLIDPNLMNRTVRDLPPPAPLAPRPVPNSAEGDDDRANPRQRMNEVALAGSSAYAKEYRLQMLHRLLMRNVPLDQIARQFQVSISTVEKDRAELKRRFREAAKELTIEEIIGNQVGIYDEISGMALRVASGGGEGNTTPTAMRLAAMRTSLAANADKTRFMNTAGVFDVLRFRQAEDGKQMSDVQRLMENTANLLAALDEPDPEPEAPRAKRVVRKRRGGFSDMTFDDADASSSANEVQEI